MSIVFVLIGWVLFITTECADKFSVCIDVLCCGCSISMGAINFVTDSQALKHIAPIYDYVAKVITTLIIWVMLNTALLFLGVLSLSDKNKPPPAWLIALG